MDYSLWGSATSPETSSVSPQSSVPPSSVPASTRQRSDRGRLVINLIDAGDPKPFRRRARGTFVAAIHELSEVPPTSCRRTTPCWSLRPPTSGSCYVPEHGVWFTTMERGHYGVEAQNGDERRSPTRSSTGWRRSPLAARDRQRVPTDFEPELWDGDEVVEEINEAGRRLGDLDLLPAPFPIEDLLDERDPAPGQAPLRHRRPVVRQPLRAQGRAPLLDERERRRQVEARSARTRHPARLRVRRGERRARC